MHLVFALAVATVIAAVGAGRTRVDVKGKLAWSTVSQMGFMVVQCAVGAFSSAVFHIAGHGMYKASLFLGAGDAISDGLRSSRRATPLPILPKPQRLAVAVVVPTAVVGVAVLLVPPDVNDAGRILVALFAWLTVSHGVRGWLERGVSPWPRAIVECTLGGLVGVLGYLLGLRVVEQFVKPAFGDAIDGVGVSATTLVVTIGMVVVALATIRLVQTPGADRLRTATDSWLVRTAHPGVAGDLPARPGGRHRVDAPHQGVASPNPTGGDADATRRTRIRADVTRASNVIAPTWPLTSVVAVNPLGGLESLGFDRAAEVARSDLRARTHLSLDEFRRDHATGLTTVDDLRWTIESHFFDECSMPPIEIDGRTRSIASIIEADMLHGPDVDTPFVPRTAVERIEGADGAVGDAIDISIQHSVAHFVTTTRRASEWSSVLLRSLAQRRTGRERAAPADDESGRHVAPNARQRLGPHHRRRVRSPRRCRRRAGRRDARSPGAPPGLGRLRQVAHGVGTWRRDPARPLADRTRRCAVRPRSRVRAQRDRRARAVDGPPGHRRAFRAATPRPSPTPSVSPTPTPAM